MVMGLNLGVEKIGYFKNLFIHMCVYLCVYNGFGITIYLDI